MQAFLQEPVSQPCLDKRLFRLSWKGKGIDHFYFCFGDFPSLIINNSISSLRIIFRENIEPSLVALGCKNPFGWPFRKLSVLLNKGEKKRGREFALRILNDRALHYIWYSIDFDKEEAYVRQGQDHEINGQIIYYSSLKWVKGSWIPFYQDIRLEVGESTIFKSYKIDWNHLLSSSCRLCKQVEVTMLNLQHTSNGFEYNYTVQISGKQYQGKMKKILVYNYYDNARIYLQHIENMTEKKWLIQFGTQQIRQ